MSEKRKPGKVKHPKLPGKMPSMYCYNYCVKVIVLLVADSLRLLFGAHNSSNTSIAFSFPDSTLVSIQWKENASLGLRACLSIYFQFRARYISKLVDIQHFIDCLLSFSNWLVEWTTHIATVTVVVLSDHGPCAWGRSQIRWADHIR